MKICEICGDYEAKYECLNCEITMCFDCIEVDDRCPDCGCKGRIFEIEKEQTNE